jgi:precorrin-6Y C5,15-methyltransferase (decarboxylating)
VCENLGSPDERVTRSELADVADHEYSPLNVMILVRKPDIPDRPLEMKGKRLFGNPDEAFLQSKPKRGLLTPQEVRTIALAQMDLGPTSVVWDVCAGSGAVAIEAAQLAAGGLVYAIEMDIEDHGLIAQNAERFAVANLVPVLGKAPEAWEGLPDPDSVFVGGAGRNVSGLCEGAFQRLKPGGRLVANVGGIESLAAVHDMLHKLAGDAKVWMINLAHGTVQLERIKFEAMNPTFLIAAVKPS